jgi:hypothetical protein
MTCNTHGDKGNKYKIFMGIYRAKITVGRIKCTCEMKFETHPKYICYEGVIWMSFDQDSG